MTDKEKILAFLEGMSKGCCPKETKEIIINIIIPWINDLPKESVSKDLRTEYGNFLESRKKKGYMLFEVAEHFANWQKEQIAKRLCNHANIDQMVEKFEDKYKPEKVLDTEYYKRGIFDTIKAIKEK